MDNTSPAWPGQKWTEPCIIDLPRIFDPRGNLTFAQNGDGHFPFDIARVYWIYDVPAGESRGSHAHVQGQGFIVAVSGSFAVNLSDGTTTRRFVLNRPYQGLYIPRMYWRTLDDFSSGSVAMVFSSTPYLEEDYIRDWDKFTELRCQQP